MKTVWKFPLEITDEQEISMPSEAEPLHVGFQGPQLCLWMLVDDRSAKSTRLVRIVGTGHEIDFPVDDPTNVHLLVYRYAGSVVSPSQALVWHVWVSP